MRIQQECCELCSQHSAPKLYDILHTKETQLPLLPLLQQKSPMPLPPSSMVQILIASWKLPAGLFVNLCDSLIGSETPFSNKGKHLLHSYISQGRSPKGDITGPQFYAAFQQFHSTMNEKSFFQEVPWIKALLAVFPFPCFLCILQMPTRDSLARVRFCQCSHKLMEFWRSAVYHLPPLGSWGKVLFSSHLFILHFFGRNDSPFF